MPIVQFTPAIDTVTQALQPQRGQALEGRLVVGQQDMTGRTAREDGSIKS